MKAGAHSFQSSASPKPHYQQQHSQTLESFCGVKYCRAGDRQKTILVANFISQYFTAQVAAQKNFVD